MKSAWSRSLQMCLCAAAVCALGTVNAQPPASAPPAEKAVPAPPQAQDGKQHTHHHHHHHHPSHQKNHSHQGKSAAPHKHEAGYGPADGHWKEHAGPHAGDIRHDDNLDQYQRNALARCNVFKDPQDQRSCVERMRSQPVSGSVKDGGVLREFTEQVTLPAAPASEHP